MGSSTTSTPDAMLAPDAAADDRERLDALARRYYEPLLSFFRKRYRDEFEAQDLVQQVFLRLAQCRELGQIRNPDGYIFRTAANVLRDHHRHRTVRENYADQSFGLRSVDDTDFSTEHVLVSREMFTRLTQALRELPQRTRDIVVLRCFEGLKHAEIARLHRISVRAVDKHMFKALAHLSAALDGGGGQS